jgi:hypothetical protein
VTALKRWLSRRAEKFLDKYYEGPEPPQRISDLVIEFANLYPTATRSQWLRFATEHAREAYRAGYQRGYEYVERDPDFFRTDLPPDMIADMHDPDWRWRPLDRGIMVPEPNGVPFDAPDEYEETLRHLKMSIERGKEATRQIWERMTKPPKL